MNNFKKIYIMYKKDLHGYFTTPLGYVFMTIMLLAGGVYVYMNNFYYGYANFGSSLSNVPIFFVFSVPILAAGIFTEEKRRGTEQLLYTLPLTSRQIVVGKYLAMLTVLLAPLLVLGIYPILMSFHGKVNFVQAYVHLFAIFLLGAVVCSICMFISALCGNIIVSAVFCFAATFGCYAIDGITEDFSPSANASFYGFIAAAIIFGIFVWILTRNIFIGAMPAMAIIIGLVFYRNVNRYGLAGKVTTMLDSIGLFDMLDNFEEGLLDLRVIFCYLSVIVLFVLFTSLTFERKRWS